MNILNLNNEKYLKTFVDEAGMIESTHIHSLLLMIDENNYKSTKEKIFYYLDEANEYAVLKYWKTIISLNAEYLLKTNLPFTVLIEKQCEETLMLKLLYDSFKELQFMSIVRLQFLSTKLFNDENLSAIYENLHLTDLTSKFDPNSDHRILRQLETLEYCENAMPLLEPISGDNELLYLNNFKNQNTSAINLKLLVNLYDDESSKLQIHASLISSILLSSNECNKPLKERTKEYDFNNYELRKYDNGDWKKIFELVDTILSTKKNCKIPGDNILLLLTIYNDVTIWENFFLYSWNKNILLLLFLNIQNFYKELNEMPIFKELTKMEIDLPDLNSVLHSEVSYFAFVNLNTFFKFRDAEEFTKNSINYELLKNDIFGSPDFYLLPILNNFVHFRILINDDSFLYSIIEDLFVTIQNRSTDIYPIFFKKFDDVSVFKHIFPLLKKKNKIMVYLLQNFEQLNKKDNFLSILDFDELLTLFKSNCDCSTSILANLFNKLSTQNIQSLIDFLVDNIKQIDPSLSINEIGQLLELIRAFLLSNHIDYDFDEIEYSIVMKLPKVISFKNFNTIVEQKNNGSIHKNIDLEIQAKLQALFKTEVSVEDLTNYLKDLKNSKDVIKNETFCAFIHFLIYESKFYAEYPQTVLVIMSNLWRSIIKKHLIETFTLDVFMKILIDFWRSNNDNLKMFVVSALKISGLQDLQIFPKYYKQLVEDGFSPLINDLEFKTDEHNGTIESRIFETYFKKKVIKSNVKFMKPTKNLISEIKTLLKNFSTQNYWTKIDGLKSMLSESSYQWFCQTLISYLLTQELETYELYIRVLNDINFNELNDIMINETIETFQILLEAVNIDKLKLKKISSWFGALIFAFDTEVEKELELLNNMSSMFIKEEKIAIIILILCGFIGQINHSNTIIISNKYVVSILEELWGFYKKYISTLSLSLEIEILFEVLGLDIQKSIEFESYSKYISSLNSGTETKRNLEISTTNFHVPELKIGFDKFSNKLVSDCVMYTISTLPDLLILDNNELCECFIMAVSKSIHTAIAHVYETDFNEMLPYYINEILCSQELRNNQNDIKNIYINVANKNPLDFISSTYSNTIQVNIDKNTKLLLSMDLNNRSDVSVKIVKAISKNINHICQNFLNLMKNLCQYETEKYLAKVSYMQIQDSKKPNIKLIPSIESQNTTTTYQLQVFPDVSVEDKAPLTSIKKDHDSPSLQSNTQHPPKLQVKAQDRDHDVPPGIVLSNNVKDTGSVSFSDAANKFDHDFSKHQRVDIQLNTLRATTLAVMNNATLSLDEAISMNIHVCSMLLEIVAETDLNKEIKTHIFNEVFQLFANIPFNLQLKEILFQFLKQFIIIVPSTRENINWWFVNQLQYNPMYIIELRRFIDENLLKNKDLDFILSTLLTFNPGFSALLVINFLSDILLIKNKCILKTDFIKTINILSKYDNIEVQKNFAKLNSYSIIRSVGAKYYSKEDIYRVIFTEFVTLLKSEPIYSTSVRVFIRQLFEKRVLSTTDELLTFFRIIIFFSAKIFDTQTTSQESLLVVDALVLFLIQIIVYLDVKGFARKDIFEIFISELLFLFNEQYHSNEFNERFYFRILSSLLCEWCSLSQNDFYIVENVDSRKELQEFSTSFYRSVCVCLHSIQPIICPGFSFAFISILSHRMLLPSFLQDETRWTDLLDLFEDVFKFLSLYSAQDKVSEYIDVLSKGIIAIFEGIVTDYPEFLVSCHFKLLNIIPESSLTLQNIVMAAQPHDVAGDAHMTKLDELTISKSSSPQVFFNPVLKLGSLKKPIVHYLRIPSDSLLNTIIKEIKLKYLEQVNGIGYDNITVDSKRVRSVVLYLLMEVGAEFQRLSYNVVFNLRSSYYTLLEKLIFLTIDGNKEISFRIISVLVEQLRYPNLHTYWSIFFLENIFQGHGDEKVDKTTLKDVQEIILRSLFERLLVNKHLPHPWGCIELLNHLISLPDLNIQELEFIRNNEHIKNSLQTFLTQSKQFNLI